MEMNLLSPDETGVVFNIQKYSIHDGPGIRTIVFLKGCPLRCAWCANPESWTLQPVPAFTPASCLGCGACAAACPQRAITMDAARHPVFALERCDGCGACAEACWSGAIKMDGRRMTVAQVMAEVRKDMPFYRNSGGGMTLSGGEALMQPRFSRALLQAARAEGIHTAIETTGFTDPETLRQIADLTDLFLFDVKHVDGTRHKAGTGVHNGQILLNLQQLVDTGSRVQVRIPVIPVFNDTPADARLFAATLLPMGIRDIRLLPFHQMGKHKYALRHLPYAYEGVPSLSEEALQPFKRILETAASDAGIPLTVGIGG